MERKGFKEYYITTERVEPNLDTTYRESISRTELISSMNGWIKDMELQNLGQIPEILNENEEDSEDDIVT